MKAKIAVFASGEGTNLQALIDAQKKGIMSSGEIALVISDNASAYALKRAENCLIPFFAVTVKGKGAFEKEVLEILAENKIDVIVLAGFMRLLSVNFVGQYQNRIINVHPSLIPNFCGKGFFGLKVHEEVLRCGVKTTGATAHFVNEIPDGGEIILQKRVRVKKGDTPLSLQQRVKERAEWIILPKATEKVCKSVVKIRK